MERHEMEHPSNWKYRSMPESGWHTIVSPENSACQSLWLFRLNLNVGEAYTLTNQALELSAVMIAGESEALCENRAYALEKYDSVYLAPGCEMQISAKEQLIMYIAGALYEGVGAMHVHKYNPSLPLGDIQQLHGKPPYRRRVYMTLGPHVPASRLITGFTWSEEGGWSSWPPHQHERDLEEGYCYFDMPEPLFGIHLSYRTPGTPEAAHFVRSGDFVIAPRGYHPTVSIPSSKNAYFWALAAHSQASRRYDLAIGDPYYVA
jgi:5-deoxy-glucuronate isomerase